MGKKLVITEKPSVAQEFAGALHVSGKKMSGSIEDDTWVITWCVGHLIRLAYPDKYDPALKAWRMDALPFLPETYHYEVIPEVAKQYGTNWKAVERNIRTVNCIIWRESRSLLEELAHRHLEQKPRNSQMLAILVSSLDTGPLTVHKVSEVATPEICANSTVCHPNPTHCVAN